MCRCDVVLMGLTNMILAWKEEEEGRRVFSVE